MAEKFVSVTPVECTPGSASAWTDVDMDSFIADLPSGITGVILLFENTSSTSYDANARKNGSSDAILTYVRYGYRVNCVCGVDSNKIFEVYTANTTDINVYIIGYIIDSEINTNWAAVAPSNVDTWYTYDSGHSDAIGLIFWFMTTTSTVRNFGIRKYGSTDERYGTTLHNSGGVLIVGAASGQCQLKSSSLTQGKFYLIGYITENATFYTNGVDCSLSTTGSYVDLTAASSTAIMNFIEASSTTVASFDLRRNGDSLEVYRNHYHHSGVVVGCDGSGVSEGKLADVNLDFFYFGYATEPASGDPEGSLLEGKLICGGLLLGGVLRR